MTRLFRKAQKPGKQIRIEVGQMQNSHEEKETRFWFDKPFRFERAESAARVWEMLVNTPNKLRRFNSDDVMNKVVKTH